MVNKGHISKKATILVLVFATLSALIGCRDAKVTSKASCADSFFLPQASSWLWFYPGEMRFIQFAVVCSPAPSEIGITTISLTGRKGAQVTPSSWSLDPGSNGDGYQPYNLSMEFDSLPPGTYELDTLALAFADGSQGKWDIGEWILGFDALEDQGAHYIRIGERTNYISDLSWYTVELTNISDQDIRVKGLFFSLPGVSTDDDIWILDPSEKMSASKTPDQSGQPPKPRPLRYSTDQSLLLMKPGSTRMFQFNYLRSDLISDVQFFTIKPLLMLEVNGAEVRASLSSALYGPFLEKEMVQEMIRRGGRLTGDTD